MNTDFDNPDIWRPIEGFPNHMVSKFGDVVYFTENGESIFLKPEPDEFGFFEVELRNKRGFRYKKVLCRLVADAFVYNKGYFEWQDIKHKDKNLENNSASNLRWVDAARNPDDKIRRKYICERGIAFDESGSKRVTSSKPIYAKNLETGEVTRYESQAEARRVLGVSGIEAVLRKKQETSGGYTFWYAES